MSTLEILNYPAEHDGSPTQAVGLFWAEDTALKAKLTGITVTDDRLASRTVPVRYRYPEGEQAKVTFPLITIEQMGIMWDTERAHVNNVVLDVIASYTSTPSNDVNASVVTEFPLPLRIGYQVTAWASNAQHMAQLTSQLVRPNKLPFHNGYLYIPADGTFRQMRVMGSQSADMLDPQNHPRRLFRRIFTVYVESEVEQTDLVKFPHVASLIIDPPTDPGFTSL